MQIITEFLIVFNSSDKIIIYGPNEIPVGHKLHGKKLHRHGCYTRELILSNGMRVMFKIFRFCEQTAEGYKTYSLLPSFITPYQRHINTFIDSVLQLYFSENKSMFSISGELDIDLPTVRRWINKFKDKAIHLDEATEKMMINSNPGYRAASYPVSCILSAARALFKKILQLAHSEFISINNGITGWINLKLKPFLGKPDNVAAYT